MDLRNAGKGYEVVKECYVCGRESTECGLCDVCKVGREKWEPIFGKEGDPYERDEREIRAEAMRGRIVLGLMCVALLYWLFFGTP